MTDSSGACGGGGSGPGRWGSRWASGRSTTPSGSPSRSATTCPSGAGATPPTDRNRGVWGKGGDIGVTGVQTCALPILVGLIETARAELTECREGDDRLVRRLRRVAERAEALALAMDFRLLYDPDRQLFAIGYNVPLGRRDNSHY